MQHWLANQRNAKCVLEALKVLTEDGMPSLVAWAKRMMESTDKWVKRAAKEALIMLLMPETIVA